MPKGYYLIFILLCWCHLAAAQQHFSVSGTVIDTQNHRSLSEATITLVQAKDSILKGFARTNTQGDFSVTLDSPGNYFILISYPGFAEYIDVISVKGKENLSNIPLASKVQALQEFVFRARASAMRINGDTTEYNADSFSVRQGATVEDLLKKLPGLQVDKDGKITAQGETVKKVLVDGEEFFSDDPAVVTQNLQSAVVDKVQVYDKKSDEASFTGIDDGERTKVINLQLKENAKRGFFGKAIAGAGPSLSQEFKGGFFENQAMINAFKGKRQISAFGIMSNTGTVGLGWQDADKFGGGNNFSFDEEGGNYIANSDPDDLFGFGRQYSGQGLPTAWTGGLHYANKWWDNQLHLTGNYRYAKNNVEGATSIVSQYNLPDSGYVSQQQQSNFSTAQRHSGNAQLEWAVDTSSKLKLYVNLGTTERKTSGNAHTETNSLSGAVINNSTRLLENESENKSGNLSIVYQKRFKKAGRSMMAEVNANLRTGRSKGLLQSQNSYYTDGLVSSQDSIDQQKENKTNSSGLNAKLSYTEPLSKVAFLSFKYGLNQANSHAEIMSYNKLGNDWNSIPDSLYSSNYDYQQTTHNGNATLKFVFKKYNFSIGADVFATSWRQHDLFQNTDRARSFTNYAPRAQFKYNFSKQSAFTFNYSGRTKQPTLQQLQPLSQNTDPLNISVGNPNLRQEFSHNIRLNYNNYKVLSGQYIYGGGGGSMTNDAIVRSETIDARGVHQYQYINTDGNWNAYFWAGMSKKITNLDLRYRLNGNLNLSQMSNFVNGLKNTTRANTYSLGIDLNKDWQKNDKDIAGFSIGPDLTYQDNKSSISSYATSFWSARINANAYAELFWKLNVSTELIWSIREQTPVFKDNNNMLHWNASLSRKFLKANNLELRASIKDILNQNLGYSRDADTYTLSETRYNTIRRHGLISLIWNFSNDPKSTNNDDDED